MTSKLWSALTVALTVVLLLALAVPTIVIDPFFHFHAPLEGLSYPLRLVNERYQNDGIVRHFSYDAILSGTSMCENFKTSDLDALFGVTSVKAPFSGGSFREVAENLDRALEANDGIRIIVRSLDYDYLIKDADYFRYEVPSYLYDSNPFNDAAYVLNSDVLVSETLDVLERTREGVPMTSFDDYASWSVSAGVSPDEYYTGRLGEESVPLSDNAPLSEARREAIRENVVSNVARQAAENPETEFYLFFPPCSIYYWDREKQYGDALALLDAITLAAGELVEYDNVHLFLFTDREDEICDISDYSELRHYSAETNARILAWMQAGENELTAENWRQACEAMYGFFDSFDYDALFASES